jgi:hypothetical protein
MTNNNDDNDDLHHVLSLKQCEHEKNVTRRANNEKSFSIKSFHLTYKNIKIINEHFEKRLFSTHGIDVEVYSMTGACGGANIIKLSV